MSRTTFLRLEWAMSLVLCFVALVVAEVRALPLASGVPLAARDVVAGAACGALLWLSIPLLRRSARMRDLWDTVLVPFSRDLATRDIVVLALLSGVSEELFFRGVLLPEIGLVPSSVLFGLLHALNPTYALWATVTGAGFGVLALYGGSLLLPIAAHVTYNLGAFVVLRRWDPRPAPLV